MSIQLHILYRINEHDEIVFVNDEWSQVGVKNGAPDIVSGKILGHSLWSCISGDTIKDIYREILRQARAGQLMRFNFRCDSSDVRRFLELSISLVDNGDLQFKSRTIWAQARQPQMLFDANAPRGDDLLISCSWCKKINTAGETWEEVEDAVVSLGLFELELLPQLSHGMCSGCYRKITKEHQARFDEINSERLHRRYTKFNADAI